ncbi:MAG: Holliday junction branch migration protein RuvA [Paludibacteraceae bacterium]|nr:Holliday junction branch migration protein RuvA [Paludibacteraceae bacterium]MBP5481606.1 Holliday junction branch migration protein RuvA [Paludibacteraceae bacterium]
MYEYIKGRVEELSPAMAIIEANQVGYAVNISLNTYAALEGKAEAKLYIHEAIREDAFTLYGFAEKAERDLFLLLISVSGVGANTARMILSSFSVPELEAIISGENVSQLKAVKGIGLKTAQRIIVDLKDKVGKETSPLGAQIQTNNNREEALTALVLLGFNRSASAKVVDKIIASDPTISLEKIIKDALKQL